MFVRIVLPDLKAPIINHSVQILTFLPAFPISTFEHLWPELHCKLYLHWAVKPISPSNPLTQIAHETRAA